MAPPSLASEFPNDNAEISGGAIWVCAQLTGPATLEVTPHEPVAAQPFVLFFDDDEDYVEGPIELTLSTGAASVHVYDLTRPVAVEREIAVEEDAAPEPEIAVEEDVAPEPEIAVEEDVAPAFAHFESALVRALMAHGASRSAALVPRLLRLEALPADALGKDVQLTLQSRGYLDGHQRYTPKFRDLCGAWSAVLRGVTHDFAACGTTTLDRFGADLLAALLTVPATRADELRRELRKSGIAAFGVLEAA